MFNKRLKKKHFSSLGEEFLRHFHSKYILLKASINLLFSFLSLSFMSTIVRKYFCKKKSTNMIKAFEKVIKRNQLNICFIYSTFFIIFVIYLPEDLLNFQAILQMFAMVVGLWFTTSYKHFIIIKI